MSDLGDPETRSQDMVYKIEASLYHCNILQKYIYKKDMSLLTIESESIQHYKSIILKSGLPLSHGLLVPSMQK